MITEFLTPDRYDEWDRFVACSPQGEIFCFSWWLEAVAQDNFRILTVTYDKQIVAGLPLVYDNRARINEPPLTRTLGPLFNIAREVSEKHGSSLKRKWLSSMLQHLNKDFFVQFCCHHSFNDWLPFRWYGLRQTTRYTYLIDYSSINKQDLWNNLDLETQRIIRKAGSEKIKIRISDDSRLAYRYEVMSYERQGLQFRIEPSLFFRVDEAAASRNSRLIFVAEDEDSKIHAVLYVVYTPVSAYALLSGSDPLLRKLGGHTLVMWEAVNYFADKCFIFNFGGSDIQRIEAHLKGFGGMLTPYFHIYNDNHAGKPADMKYHISRVFFHMSELIRITGLKLKQLLRK